MPVALKTENAVHIELNINLTIPFMNHKLVLCRQGDEFQCPTQSEECNLQQPIYFSFLFIVAK